MFSSRLDWAAVPNKLARMLEGKRSAGVQILDLTESNPTAAGLSYGSDQIVESFADARWLRYEPAPAGIVAAREAVSQYYSNRVPMGRILLTASTSEAYGFLFKLLADPGDEILAPRPSYPLFDFLAALDSVRIVQYPLIYHGRWSIDFEAMAARVTPRTRAIVIVNPNNPTGSFLKKPELTQLAAFCKERDLAILSDEVFSDYGLEEDPERVRSLTEREDVLSFSFSGLSKVAGLPQLKLGWIVVNGPETLRAQAFERLELIADTYLSVGAPVQWAAAALLDLREGIQREIQQRVRRNLEFLRATIGASSPWRVLDVEGGWYAVLEGPRIHTEENWVLSLLEQDNVLVQPGFFFDFEREAFLILSLLTRPDVFEEGVRRILGRIPDPGIG
ncbi:MAG TPA: pyridoxal phosphate-dependent aminotransferase [Bryobacteraceae bacterium]|nr:pyridoxal phosphate-dependent aminotransferase [Bryobacteraceae bacterium]